MDHMELLANRVLKPERKDAAIGRWKIVWQGELQLCPARLEPLQHTLVVVS
jgi:hypothetical protein